MADINMDINDKKKNKDGAQLEFRLPVNEVKENVRVGQTGAIRIPVKVIQVDDAFITFMKDGESEGVGTFAQPTAVEMREHLDVAER